MTQTFQLANTVTFAQNDDQNWMILNWLNNEYAIVDDVNHPIFLALSQQQKEIIYHPDYDEDFQWLLEKGFFLSAIDSQQGIEKAVSAFRLETQKRLNLILFPADEACNFNCVYCYEDHQAKKRMGMLHQTAILKWIEFARPEEMDIHYFGGEPLLNAPFILHLNQAILAQFPLLKFTSSMTTNGALLTEPLLEKLYAQQVRHFQITLDGLPSDHDRLRISKRNTGTYESVLASLKTIVSRPDLEQLSVIIRINFNDQTATPEKRAQVIANLKNLIGADDRFKIALKPIGDYSTPNQHENQRVIQHVCGTPNVSELMAVYEAECLSADLKVAGVAALSTTGGARCYAASPTHFILTPDFKLKKCTVAMRNPLNEVGELDPNTGIPQLNARFADWVKPLQQCYQHCFLGKTCQGQACPLKNMQENKSVCLPHQTEKASLTHRVITLAAISTD